MFYSINNLFSVQIEGRRWYPCEDEVAVEKIISIARSLNRGFRVVTRFCEQIEYCTHKFTNRFIWGGWGK